LAGNTAQVGGGIANVGRLTLDGCRLIGNTATQEGGALDIGGGPVSLINHTFIGGTTPAEANQAESGAGIFMSGADHELYVLIGSHVIGNVATIEVGGIRKSPSSSVIIDFFSTVQDNTPCDCDCDFDGCATTCL
jgi:hypothetical protein